MKTKESLKKLIGSIPVALLAAAIGAAPAWGVEALQNGFSLWDEEDGVEALMRLDADPATPGRELIVLSMANDLFIDLGTTIRSKIRAFARVVAPDNSSEIGRLSQRIFLNSLKYPDPGLAANQEGGANETTYGGDNLMGATTIPAGFTTAEGVDQIIDHSFEFPFGLGVAENTGAITQTLVIGLGIEGTYSNNTEPYVEVSKFAFYSFDAVPSAGEFNFLCAQAFAGRSGNWFLERVEAGVGNFLAGARVNDDEIRVVEYNDTAGFARYRYFDPTDCSLLDTVFVRIIN